MESTEQLRWNLIDPLYKRIVDILYDNELTGNEIDTLINMVWSKVIKDKLVTVSYFEILKLQAMDSIVKNNAVKKPDTGYIG